MYDLGRDREIHVEKSLDVINYDMKNKCGKIENFTKLETLYFTTEKIDVKGLYEDRVNEEFQPYNVVSGYGTITSGDSILNLNEDETIYIQEGC